MCGWESKYQGVKNGDKKFNKNSYKRESGTEMEKGRQSVGQRTVIAGKVAHYLVTILNPTPQFKVRGSRGRKK